MELLGLVFAKLGSGLRWVFSYRSEIEYRRMCQERPLLDDDAFVDRFYHDSSIPRDIPIRVRNVYRDQLKMAKVFPEDVADEITPDLDLGELMIEVEEEFGIDNLIDCEQPFNEALDGSFDAIVRRVADVLTKRSGNAQEGRDSQS